MNNFLKKIKDYTEKYDTDILLYFGDIRRGDDEKVISLCRQQKLKKNILVCLATRGGDPNVAYKISKCLQIAYNTKSNSTHSTSPIEDKGVFSIFIDGFCKSAGTLICLGANNIIMSGNAELGPIDIQLRKREEVGESESGLTPYQALKLLELQSILLFKSNFKSLRFSDDLLFPTKKAADIAKDITVGLLSPIYAQIDPIRLAEVDRSMRIAKEYGERLVNGNLKVDTLDQLLGQYPSHGFVIDREEAKKLFNDVGVPTSELRDLANFFRSLTNEYLDNDKENFLWFSAEDVPPLEEETGEKNANE